MVYLNEFNICLFSDVQLNQQCAEVNEKLDSSVAADSRLWFMHRQHLYIPLELWKGEHDTVHLSLKQDICVWCSRCIVCEYQDWLQAHVYLLWSTHCTGHIYMMIKVPGSYTRLYNERGDHIHDSCYQSTKREHRTMQIIHWIRVDLFDNALLCLWTLNIRHDIQVAPSTRLLL